MNYLKIIITWNAKNSETPKRSFISAFSICMTVPLNNALNSIHERALRLIYNNHELPFDTILQDNKQKSIYQKNIELLAIGIYKFQAGLKPLIISDLFVTKENKYNP